MYRAGTLSHSISGTLSVQHVAVMVVDELVQFRSQSQLLSEVAGAYPLQEISVARVFPAARVDAI